MDFDEFYIVVKHLKTQDRALGLEIEQKVKEFQSSSKSGQSLRKKFKSIRGYLVLEREDEYAFGIVAFTDEAANSKLEKAYESATNELGI